MRDGWVETTLDRVTECSWGNTETTKSKYVESGYLAYSASGADGFLDWFEHDRTAVVLSAIGAQCGKTWFADGQWTSIKNTIWLKSDNLNLLDKYLFYLSNGDQFWQIRGQAQPFISLGDVKKTKVLLPPLSEQKRIVNLISSVDSYIEALEQQLGSVRSASNAHLEKIVSAFSDDWREITLGEVLEISRGGSPRPIQEYLTDSEDGINWVKIADATRSEKYIYSTLQKIKREGISRSREVFSGDFVLSNSMSFGRPYIMRTDGCIHDGWLLLSKVSNNFDEDFLYNLLNSDYVQRQFESLAAGSGVRNLNIEVVKKVKVKIPTIEVQKELASVINEFDNFIIKLTKQIHSGLDLRQALLSDLLSGDHKIPESYDKVMGAA